MSVLGTVAAGVTGFFTGWNPQAMALAYSVGSGVDSVINAPDRVGPRLEDLRVQLSQYGAMVPFEWGTNRHAGTIMWPRILEAVENRQEESAKGGPDNISYTYTLSCAVLICEGPIAGVRRIWANKKIVYDVSVENEGETRDPVIGAVRFHLGTEDQTLDPLIEATDGAGPAYRGYAYVVFEDYDVTDLGGRPPQWEFEVITEGVSDLPPPTTFGEYYGLANSSVTFDADMDPNGHIWLNTMQGHARISPVSGLPEISAEQPATPQIHEYDAETGELLWFYNVPPITEGSDPPEITYPIAGKGVCSGGYYFVGRGKAGNVPEDGSFVHGLAVNIQTHAVTDFIDQCSSGQFQNAGYWPTVPVPIIDNNKVYIAAGNGAFATLGVGFMPNSVGEGPGAVDPLPDRSGEIPLWNIPAGWHQARAKGTCPAPENGFDGVALNIPHWAYKATVLSNGAVIVQGEGGNQASYLMWVAHSPIVDGFDLSPPSNIFTVNLPGSSAYMPPLAWDPVNETLWTFAGIEQRDTLYAIRPDGSVTDTGFVVPLVDGEFQSNDVKGMAFDEMTGMIRLIRGTGPYSRLSLLNPVTGSISEEMPMAPVSLSPGKMWILPGGGKSIYTDGFALYSIEYAPSLAPNGIPLSKIVADVCKRAGLQDGDIDVTDLADMVDGYIVPRQMTARAAIEPLQQAFFFDAVESDDKVKFVKRGKSAATLIPIEDRAAHERGEELPDALTVTRAFELELPVQCDVEYPDIEADHLIGNQSDRRITKDTRHNMNLQLPIVMTAAKAKSVARTLLYEAWQNQSFRFKTTRKYARLEPTDLVELPTSAALYRGRITAKREQPGGIIEWEARVDSVSVYTQTGEGAVPIPYPPQSIFVPTLTQLELLDIPMLRDEDNDPGFYVAMGAL